MINSEITKITAKNAWQLYNYLNKYERMVFGCKKSHNAISILILTIVALRVELTTSEISEELGLSYGDVYRFVDNLEKYFGFLIHTENGFKISDKLLENASKEEIECSKDVKQVFTTVLANLKYHTKILNDNLGKDSQENVKLVRSLLNPVMSNPIAIEDCRTLSRLGYMKYRPQKKELKLNAVAYLKDWVCANAI